MTLENIPNLKDITLKLNSKDQKTFKKAYKTLATRVRYAKKHFRGFPIHRQLQKQLKKYTPRYKQLPT